jgi:hypothetical protein
MQVNVAIASKEVWMKIEHNGRHESIFSLILGAWLAFFAGAPVLGDNAGLDALPQITEQNASAVTVKYSDIDNATIYSISIENCSIDWISRNSEIGVIIHRAQCTVPLSGQLPLLTQICTEFFRKDKNAPAFRTLFWGRLAPDGSQAASQDLSFRLARAAHKSPGWDVKKGRPKNGDINGFVRDLANRQMIYPELKELFERFHKSISFSCAEKVLVLEAGKLPFFDQLKQYGIQASDRLPFDCMAWFSVSAQ